MNFLKALTNDKCKAHDDHKLTTSNNPFISCGPKKYN